MRQVPPLHKVDIRNGVRYNKSRQKLQYRSSRATEFRSEVHPDSDLCSFKPLRANLPDERAHLRVNYEAEYKV